MTKLVDDLLDVSRVTRGLISLEKTRLDIRHIANHAVEQIAPLIRARRHHLRLELTPHTMMVSGDEKRLVQVLANLLDNALKYSPDGQPVRVSVQPDGAGLRVSVSDAGIGLPPGARESIFEPFGRAANAAGSATPGPR